MNQEVSTKPASDETGQEVTSPASRPKAEKYDFERMNNHIQNLVKEKKAHLKKIAFLEEQLKSNANIPKAEKMIDIFSTAQENAEKYFDNVKNLADSEMANAKEKSSKTLKEAEEKAQKILNQARDQASLIERKASEQTFSIQKKNEIILQETEKYKASVEAQVNETKAKLESSQNQSAEKAERIIIKAKEDAANILTEANIKLDLANKKYDQIIHRAEVHTNHIINCARSEYEALRSLIEKSTDQYIQLCKELSDFDHLYSFTISSSSLTDDNIQNDSKQVDIQSPETHTKER